MKKILNTRNKRFDKKENEQEYDSTEREDIVFGRNAVIEALKSKQTVEEIFVAKGDMKGSINVIMALAREKGIIVKEADRRKLDGMTGRGIHQGVVAVVTPFRYCEVSDILEYAKSKKEDPFIVILDEIEDTHNVGAIIRTAEVFGCHGIIIGKRRCAGISQTVYKTSAGAVQYMKIAKVTNINYAIDELKENGIFVYGADMNGKAYPYEENFEGGTALVIGNEGKGISRLTKEKCDELIKIPMAGNVSSLNASVAGSILMYEVMKRRISGR